jgi:ubiquitin-protein ligase
MSDRPFDNSRGILGNKFDSPCSMRALGRIQKELEQLAQSPPPGIIVWVPDESNVFDVEGSITGPDNSPYERGIFRVTIGT